MSEGKAPMSSIQVLRTAKSGELFLLAQQPTLERITHQGGTADQAELGHQPGLVSFDRLGTEIEPLSYLLAGIAQSDQPQYLLLARAEPLV